MKQKDLLELFISGAVIYENVSRVKVYDDTDMKMAVGAVDAQDVKPGDYLVYYQPIEKSYEEYVTPEYTLHDEDGGELYMLRIEEEPTPRQMMDRWASFCYNHPPYEDVILWMVGGDKKHYLYQHFCSKWLYLCEDVCHNDTMGAWMKFYRTLDDQWADRLMEYVYCEWKKH